MTSDEEEVSFDSDSDHDLQPVDIYAAALRAINSEPSVLIGRESQHNQLFNYLNERIIHKTSGSLYVSGVPGTGKTALINCVLNAKQLPQTKLVQVNCFDAPGIELFKKILTQLQPKQKITKLKSQEVMQRIASSLCQSRSSVLIILDEIDQLKIDKLMDVFGWPCLQDRDRKSVV